MALGRYWIDCRPWPVGQSADCLGQPGSNNLADMGNVEVQGQRTISCGGCSPYMPGWSESCTLLGSYTRMAECQLSTGCRGEHLSSPADPWLVSHPRGYFHRSSES